MSTHTHTRLSALPSGWQFVDLAHSPSVFALHSVCVSQEEKKKKGKMECLPSQWLLRSRCSLDHCGIFNFLLFVTWANLTEIWIVLISFHLLLTIFSFRIHCITRRTINKWFIYKLVSYVRRIEIWGELSKEKKRFRDSLFVGQTFATFKD